MGVDSEHTQKSREHINKHEGETMDNKVARWKQEREAKDVSWDSFCQAMKVFDMDLGIVNHTDTPKRRVIDEPHSDKDENGHAQYSLSTADMEKRELTEAIKDKKVVILVMCMDARAQHQTYEQVKDEHPKAVILTLSMGGGMVQQDTIIRNHQDTNVYRSQALATQLAYLSQIIPNGSLEAVYATGHDCQCGACKYFNDDEAVHEVLHAQKGGEKESNEMSQRIKKGVKESMPVDWTDKVIEYLVHIDPTTNEFARMIKI